MTKTSVAYALALAAAIATPALAQNATTPNTAMPNSTNMMTTKGPAGQDFVSQAQPGDWRSSKLIGVNIYGPDNASIGEVNDVIVDKTGAAKAVVVGVGGFLGIGQKNVALPFTAVQWSDKPVGNATASNEPANSTAAATGAGGSVGMAPGAAPASPVPATNMNSAPSILDYPDHGSVTLTKDQLQSAPDFHYASDAPK